MLQIDATPALSGLDQHIVFRLLVLPDGREHRLKVSGSRPATRNRYCHDPTSRRLMIAAIYAMPSQSGPRTQAGL